MIRVLVVDDHPIVLSGLSALIESEDGLELVGAARSVAEAMEVAAEADVAIVDLHLPDGDGIALGGALKGRWTGLRVLVLTMSADQQSVIRSLAAGLNGYLLKDADPKDIVAAIHSAARGALVVGHGASQAVMDAVIAAPRTDGLSALDARDIEILDLFIQGLSTAQVAARLFIAPKTVRNRTSEMLSKLGVPTRDEAIAIGRAAGLGH